MGPRAEGELQAAPCAEILVNDSATEAPQPLAQEDGEPAHVEDNDEEEAEPKRIAPSPVLPTAAEIEDHRITHIPFRSWCPHCVAARALGEQRGIKAPEWQYDRHLITIVGLDYFYLTSGGVTSKKEVQEMGFEDDETI